MITALPIQTLHRNNTIRTIGAFVGIAAGIASVIYLFHQIKLTKVQLEKHTKEEETRDKDLNDLAKKLADKINIAA